MTIQEWYQAKGRADGNHRNWQGVAEVFSEVDRPVAEGDPCETCGGPLRADMYMHDNEYHVAAICDTCGTATEF